MCLYRKIRFHIKGNHNEIIEKIQSPVNFYSFKHNLTFIFINITTSHAHENSEVCALTPDRINGQGFSVSSQGFSISSQGFSISSQGFSVSSFGFSVSSQEEAVIVIEEILNNPVTPKLLVEDLSDIIGPGFNSKKVYLLVVDDFSAPDAHGFKVRKTIEDLIDGVDRNDGSSSVPNIEIKNINIANEVIDFEASRIAGIIKDAIDHLPDFNNSHVVVNMSFGLVPCEDDSNPTIVDDESGQTFHVNKTFSFDDYEDGPPKNRPFEPLSPIVECIVIHYEEGSSDKKKPKVEGYTAYFGYNNANSYSVEIQ